MPNTFETPTVEYGTLDSRPVCMGTLRRPVDMATLPSAPRPLVAPRSATLGMRDLGESGFDLGGFVIRRPLAAVRVVSLCFGQQV